MSRPTSTVTTPGGATIAYDTLGDPGAPPMVLVQGYGAQLLGWPPGFCALLADQGFQVIRFDNRDVGRSQRYPRGGYGVADMAGDTAALLDGLGIDAAHVVGQSLGGIIAQHLALDHPGRVRSLGLVYTTSTVRHFIGGEDIARAAGLVVHDRAGFVAGYLANEAACASAGYPQDIAWLAELGGQMYDRAGHDPDGQARQLAAALSITDFGDRLPALGVPTVILAGDSDRLIDHAASVDLHRRIAGSTLTVFPGMGHELPRPLWPEIVGLLGANARRASAIEKEPHDART